ncbi:MAG: hypothetical protein GX096_09715 [Clostridiales bacterium]|nr:hypothetical protein [Clostridiales bacterium]
MKRKTVNGVMVALGLLLLLAGLYLVKAVADPQGIMKSLPYLCIGIGCGVFGHGMGEIISSKAMKNDPARAKQIHIEQKDERNLAIACKSKAKAFDLMIFVFGALMVCFALMGVDVIAVLLLVFAYLFVVGYRVYLSIQYSKEM